VSNANEGSA